jgi:hypothetical protein
MPAQLLQLSSTETTLLLAGSAVALVLGALAGWRIGVRKYRPVLGFFMGGLFTLPGLLALALIPRKEPAYY